MARRPQSQGTCLFCGREMAKGGLSRHLPACSEREQAIAKAEESGRPQEELYHLRVQDTWDGVFWLDLEMRGSATLKDLDRYLRAIWLECCGHMSEFAFQAWEDEIPMSRRARDLFEPGMELVHLYDFGTTSETAIQVKGVRKGRPLSDHPIFLMARNQQPPWSCMECDKPAKWLCMECVYELDEPGTLCDEHADEHPHDEYGDPQPLVNSPRVGMCGYSGPATPPY